MALLSYRSASDDELVALLHAGDHGAYTEIYDRYADRLYTQARFKIGSREDARDIVQDVFAALWHNRIGLRPNGTLPAYLSSAVRYKVINRLIQRNLHAQYLDVSEMEHTQQTTDHPVRERELQQQINTEIAQLPDKMREVFCLSREQYLSHREIAERLNLSEATVKKQVNNALKVLRMKLNASLVLLLAIFFH